MLFLVARYKLSGAVAAVSLMGLAKCGSARLFVAAAFHVLVPCFTFTFNLLSELILGTFSRNCLSTSISI